jgi:hypothetical protein
MATFTSRHISITLRRLPDEVYAFVVNPENLPRWAKGLSGSIREIDGEWVADSPMGKVKVRFAPRNSFGVLDHDVVLESGITVRNPLRVVANGDGSELTFTLFKRPGMTEEEFTADAGAVARDLEALKALLEAA